MSEILNHRGAAVVDWCSSQFKLWIRVYWSSINKKTDIVFKAAIQMLVATLLNNIKLW